MGGGIGGGVNGGVVLGGGGGGCSRYLVIGLPTILPPPVHMPCIMCACLYFFSSMLYWSPLACNIV